MDFDFRTLLNLAEQRRGRCHDTPPAVPAVPAVPAAPRQARARKVSVMPSPDDHFLSLERERRAEKHEMRTMAAMSPTSPTSELVTCLRDSLCFAYALHMLDCAK